MKPRAAKKTGPVDTLRAAALTYPETQEGVACAGTAAERPTVNVRDKAFLFLGEADLRLKLRESLPEAAEWAGREPGDCSVGAGGWVKVTFDDEASLPLDVLTRWVGESYRLLAPRNWWRCWPTKGEARNDR